MGENFDATSKTLLFGCKIGFCELQILYLSFFYASSPTVNFLLEVSLYRLFLTENISILRYLPTGMRICSRECHNILRCCNGLQKYSLRYTLKIMLIEHIYVLFRNKTCHFFDSYGNQGVRLCNTYWNAEVSIILNTFLSR